MRIYEYIKDEVINELDTYIYPSDTARSENQLLNEACCMLETVSAMLDAAVRDYESTISDLVETIDSLTSENNGVMIVPNSSNSITIQKFRNYSILRELFVTSRNPDVCCSLAAAMASLRKTDNIGDV